jgi:AraC-like DNA-binding protein
MEKIYNLAQAMASTTGNSRLSFPSPMGKGYIQNVGLKSGIQLTTADYTLKRPVTLDLEPPFKPIGFSFRLSGYSRKFPVGQKTSEDFKSGLASFKCADLKGLTVNMGTEREVRVSIFMDLTQFYAFAREETDGLPFELNNPSSQAFSHVDQITPAMRAAIFQIFNCPYQEGWAKNFFLESKALELMAHKIGQIEATQLKIPDVNSLPLQDEERIREAARLLACDLETPPDLNQLARSVGMCRSKLFRCFRMVYGMTPFEYLRNRRLETAMDLLMDGRMNVAQAAYAVGFSCPSYFTKAFKKYFGHLPSKNPIKIK